MSQGLYNAATRAIAGAGVQISPLNTIGMSSAAGQMSFPEEVMHLGGRGMSIRIVPANGGTIISIRDENVVGNSDLYIIPESGDIGQEIGKIITLHYLKK
jgi:hypothetical protein